MSISVGQQRDSVGGSHSDPLRFRLFAGLIVGVTLLLLTLGRLSFAAEDFDPIEVAAWTVLVALTGFVPLGRESGPRLAMDLPLLLAAAFAFHPLTAGLIAFAGATDIRELRQQISLTRSFWNRAQTSLSVMAASAVFGSIASLGDWPRTGVAAALALASDASVNYLVVGYGTSLRTGQRFVVALREMRFGSARSFLPTYACFGFIGVLVAEAHARLGLAAVIAALAPVALGTFAFLHRLLLDKAEGTLEARESALRRVDQRIADERRDERSRIAEALHDDVLQDLYNISIRAQVLRQDLMNGQLLDLESDLPLVLEATEAAVEDLREVIQGLRTASIGHAGLVETLSLFANHLAVDSGIQTVLATDPTLHSTPERELVVYQIARECLTNAIRHSGAKTIWVTLKRGEAGGPAYLAVEDDGVGFDPNMPIERHYGLELMRERAKSIAGSISIRSSPGCGTVVTLLFTE
jgi:signal transduction histidine kinase